MPECRNDAIATFLAGTPAVLAERRPLAGDASPRRYERLTLNDGRSFVLMDAPPDSGEDIRPFMRIALWLSDAGFSAPKIIADAPEHGFLLLEDLGDALFADEVARDPSQESNLYSTATDVLAALQTVPPPKGIEVYDASRLSALAAFAWRWYRLDVTGEAPGAEKSFRDAFAQVLTDHAGPPAGVALRDYHAQNLIWLPDRTGQARVGLLDFQDAVLAPSVYDLVSLLSDARRDVPQPLAQELIDRFATSTGLDPTATRAACAVVGLQRNLRIIGVFARLSLHFGKTHYLGLIPRVWAHIQRDLAHPANDPVREAVVADLPLPTPDHLQELERRCGTIPTR